MVNKHPEAEPKPIEITGSRSIDITGYSDQVPGDLQLSLHKVYGSVSRLPYAIALVSKAGTCNVDFEAWWAQKIIISLREFIPHCGIMSVESDPSQGRMALEQG